ncbi:hypothetical protein [Nitratifractor sp.]|uniref:hypothetical protein n=1 Tax=Nitratifractor sp. TaxID=2268144 RepID=UPI0025FF8564|nr:hypothetical protein [Nitratifractor sp.]
MSAVASRKSQVTRSVAFGNVIGHLFRRLSFVVCRLKFVGSRQSAVGKRVASRQSLVASSVVSGNVIGILVYGYIADRAKTLYAGLKSRLQKSALRSNAPTSKIHHQKSIIKSVAQQRKPKLFIIHHSPFIISRDSNPTLQKLSFPVPHSSFLIPHSDFPKEIR